MDEGTNDRMKEPVWIQNEYGVKSVWTRKIAEEKVRKNYGWEFAVPDEVPATKQYPLGSGMLTEDGIRRRKAATEAAKMAETKPVEEKIEDINDLSMDDLRAKAKKGGIEKYWVKSRERLVKELSEKV